MRIAINGMGRIGRVLFRKLINHPQIELVAVNDLMPADNLFYLLKYDSVYGPFSETMEYADNTIQCGEKKVQVLQSSNPDLLPWSKLKVDIVLECTGRFTTKEKATAHLKAGAKKVLLSTTGADDIPLAIFGFNHTAIKSNESIISPGGCMTNCSANVLAIINTIGIESAQLHFLHSYTSRQDIVDAAHPQFRRGRAAAESIIPVEIDLHFSLEKLLPQLKGRIASLSTRIPVANGAMADFTIQLSRLTTAREINELFRNAAADKYKHIVSYTEEEIVSLDIKGNMHSCIIDGTLSSVVGHQLKLIAWFDNEFGFTSRMVDWLEYWDKESI